MTILAGALAFTGRRPADERARALVAAASRYPGLTQTELPLDALGVTAFALGPSASTPLVRRLHGTRGIARVIVGQTVPDQEATQAINDEFSSPGSSGRFLPCGRWLALESGHAPDVLRVLGDPLGGAWLYLARTDDGVLFSSDFGALAASLPGPLTVDQDSVLAMLALAHDPGTATVFREISVLPPGAVVECGPAGMLPLTPGAVQYGDALAGLSFDAKCKRLDDALEAAILQWCMPWASQLVVSLSGGFDSRFGLALLSAGGLRPTCLTWGHRQSHDALTAHALAASHGLPWTLHETLPTSWAAWQRCIQQVGAGGFQWGGWAEEWLPRLGAAGAAAVLGSLGDALSGKHLVEHPAHPADWLRNWDAWSTEDGWVDSPLLRLEARRRLPEVVQSRLGSLAGTAATAFPHQRALHLDLLGRQRRFTFSQANLMSRFLSPLPFFYTPEIINFWSNLPYEDLRGQALYLAYARRRFPTFFPPAPGRPSLGQRASGTLRNLIVSVFPTLKQALVPSEIDLQGILLRHRADIRALIEAVRPLLEPILDVAGVLGALDGFPRRRVLGRIRIVRLLNVCMLLSLMVRPEDPAGGDS